MITGRCECGSVQYQVDGEINDFSHCHCSQCRRLHGAAFASYGGVVRSEFSYLSGQPDLTNYASSDDHTRVFCRICGSNILVELDLEPESVYLAMGTVNGDPKCPPGYHIFVGSKAPWYKFDDPAVRHDTFPEDE
jgi:hypothetical protein